MALGIGIAYVFGMVAPLYLASLFIHKRNILEKPIFKKQLGNILIGKKIVPITLNNLIAFLIFSLTGIIMGLLTITGNLSMDAQDVKITKSIQDIALSITEKTGNLSLFNLLFILISLYLLYRFKKILEEEKGNKN